MMLQKLKGGEDPVNTYSHSTLIKTKSVLNRSNSIEFSRIAIPECWSSKPHEDFVCKLPINFDVKISDDDYYCFPFVQMIHLIFLTEVLLSLKRISLASSKH